ncbi:sigma-70 family RNA polymerase sigma factor [Streptomyces sp. HNM0663]|uniref:Sigma-70 family RNA polymerase sigma factor n=1 Tax=Streptomyces chengmaiensis TaxID=3040919 RepID=A0ABT6HUH6_9ACTN|nr:sigma-70 family RNA polymerase sigma factor [Streptomyces chengmaiensis]MDH2392369.1 sigma-70 family RNA polymerase sigma factor [Streptomyces chengmaiensis]
MSGDGRGDRRDESLDSAGGAEAAGLPSRQVPSQGGPRGASGMPGVGADPDASDVRGPEGEAVSGTEAVSGGHSVPPQWGRTGRRGPRGRHAERQEPRSRHAERQGGRREESVLPPPVKAPPSDADLVQRMRDGEDSAYEELFRRHSEAVRRYARSCCRDAHTADDLTAEVFARTLQAVRSGAGPEQAVRAYLLTTVRRVAAAWTKTAKREHLVDDFAVFAVEAARSADGAHDDALGLGADVRAMHEAEQSLALQAFRSLPERWQAVLWHTTVEEESPSEVAPLFGLTANATAVLASRAREGLKQAYLQAHVSSALTSGGDCARYADRLGAYARGGLRMRAERGLRRHLEECARCRLAAGELEHVNAGIPALLPVAVIGWFAAGYSLKAAGVAAGGAAGAAGAAAGGGASGSAGASGAAGSAAAGGATGGSSTGSAAAGASGTAGASGSAAASAGGTGGSSTGSAAAGGAAGEGVGAAAKATVAAALAAAAAAAVVWAMAGDREIRSESAPQAKPPAAQPVPPPEPAPSSPSPEPSEPPAARAAAPAVPSSSATPPPAPTPTPAPTPSKAPTPTPTPTPTPASVTPTPEPSPTPTPTPTSPPTPEPPPPAPEVYQVNQLRYTVLGDHTGPEVRLGGSSWLWQRWGMSIAGTHYAHGVTVHGKSSVTIDLNRSCSAYQARAGVDDMMLGLGAVRFSVYGDGARLWRSPVIRSGDPAVPVNVSLIGRKTLRLVVEPQSPFDAAALADWAESRISCR